jgi:hypothetical protein
VVIARRLEEVRRDDLVPRGPIGEAVTPGPPPLSSEQQRATMRARLISPAGRAAYARRKDHRRTRLRADSHLPRLSPDVLARPRQGQMRVAARLRHPQSPEALASGDATGDGQATAATAATAAKRPTGEVLRRTTLATAEAPGATAYTLLARRQDLERHILARRACGLVNAQRSDDGLGSERDPFHGRVVCRRPVVAMARRGVAHGGMRTRERAQTRGASARARVLADAAPARVLGFGGRRDSTRPARMPTGDA